MKPQVIVVTGATGSGKSTLCRKIATALRFDHRNVGDELRNVLQERGVCPSDRTVTGSVFVRHFSEAQYAELVMGLLKPFTVLDGVRLAAALRAAHSQVALLHVHRSGPPTVATRPLDDQKDQFEAEAKVIGADAELQIGWTQEVDELDEIVMNRVARLVQLPEGNARR